MSPANDKNLEARMISAALPLFAEKGMKVTAEDIANRSGLDTSLIKDRFEDPVDILHHAYRLGQKDMERLFRTPIDGTLEEYIGVLFDGMMLNIKHFGPQTYLGVVYRATEDKVLLEVVKRQSVTLNFAVKAFLMDMVSNSIIESVEGVERVNQELVATFVEHLAKLLEGMELSDVRKAWIKQASIMFIPGAKTTPSSALG
ncbi:MAG: TetR/AcrR family transcriptional regulator [Euryarchaeota archaeon]|nr:TetR/AcrR family transcriptional regulator [Euryarchaeota archaeon]